MNKGIRLVGLIAILLALGVGLAYWQLSQLGKSIRAIKADPAKEALMSALSTEVLAPGIDGDSAQADRSQPLLDQYRKNPALVHQRYLLVLTWMHATKIFKAIGKESMPKGQLINSASLKEVPAENRVDGWGKP